MALPDLLIFLSDQHQAGLNGYAGDPLIRTPHLDALAASGLVFDSAYTSCPLCVPARAGFLTSQLPSHNAVYDNNGTIRSDSATFVHALSAAGYETVLVGRMHFLGFDQRHGFTRRLVGDLTPTWWGGRTGKCNDSLGLYNGTLAWEGCLRVIGGGGCSPTLEYDREVVAAATDYLGRPHAQPQCIVVGTYGPHFPYVGREDLYRYYRPRVSLPTPRPDQVGYENEFLAALRHDPDTPTALAARAAYCAMIEEQDEHVGAVHQAWTAHLKRSGRDGCFIYASDHGDHNGGHGIYGKETFLEASARIPLIVTGMDLPCARVSSPVSLLDLGPTLCELAGAPALPDPDGHSLLPHFRQPDTASDRAVLSEYIYRRESTSELVPARMIRQGQWKLITHAHPDVSDLLFDLKADPEETIDLSAQYPEIADSLRAQALAGWIPQAITAQYQRQARHHALLRSLGPLSGPPEEFWTGFHGRDIAPTVT